MKRFNQNFPEDESIVRQPNKRILPPSAPGAPSPSQIPVPHVGDHDQGTPLSDDTKSLYDFALHKYPEQAEEWIAEAKRLGWTPWIKWMEMQLQPVLLLACAVRDEADRRRCTPHHFRAMGEYSKINWRDRPEVNKEVLQSGCVKWLRAFKEHASGAAARHYGAFIVIGGSGTGKTRTGIQLPALLKEVLDAEGYSQLQYILPLPENPTISHAVGDDIKPAWSDPNELEAQNWMLAKIAREHNIPIDNTLTLNQVLSAIRTAHQIPPDRHLVLFVQIDEFQWNVPLCTHLLRRVGKQLADMYSAWHQNKTIIILTLSGTWIGDLTVATELEAVEMCLAGLESLQATQAIFADALVNLHTGSLDIVQPMIETFQHRHILSMLGRIPRMVLAYAKVCATYPHMAKSIGSSDSDYHCIWGFTEEAVRRLYKASTFIQDTVDHLLCLWYFKIPVFEQSLINGTTIKDIQMAGYVFPRSDGASYLIGVPFVFAVVWRKEIFEVAPFQYTSEQLDRELLPKFILQVHQTTYKMLGLHAQLKKKLGAQSGINREFQELGGGQMRVKSTINEIYAFAAEGPPSLLDAEVWVNPDVSIVRRPAKPADVPLPDPEMNKLYETPPLHHGPDGYTPHAAEQYKSSDSYAHKGGSDTLLGSKEIASETEKGHEGRDFLIILTPKDTDHTLELVDDGVFQTTTYSTRGKPCNKNAVIAKHEKLLMIRTAANLEKFGRGLIHFSSHKELEVAMDFRPMSQATSSAPL